MTSRNRRGRGASTPPGRPGGAAFFLFVSAMAALGCGSARPVATVELDTLTLSEAPPQLTAPVELCLDATLRQRQWNVAEHAFRVELGSRAALHFERLIKRHFANVLVTFGPECGRSSGRPWISGRIVSAHRELYNEVEDDTQYTAIVFETTLHAQGDEILWQATRDGVVGRPPALGGHALFAGWQKGSILFFPIDVLAAFEDRPRHTRACEDFGSALGLALQNTDLALTEATSLLETVLPAPSPADQAADAQPEPRYSQPLAPLDPLEAAPAGEPVDTPENGETAEAPGR